MTDRIHFADNLDVLRALPDGSVDLIYIDPPFNTGRRQSRTRLRTVRDPEGDRVGFGGRRYATTVLGRAAFADAFHDYLAFLEPRLVEAHRVLAPHGSLYFHIDPREAAACRLLLDAIFGRAAMGQWTLAVLGVRLPPDRRAGFVLLAGHVNPKTGDRGAGERLQDHACALARAG